MGNDFPPSLAQTKDARGIYASSSNASSSSMTIFCNLLVHSSSLSMERCSTDVPGLQRDVSMHGRVIGPILMLDMQGTCCSTKEQKTKTKAMGKSECGSTKEWIIF